MIVGGEWVGLGLGDVSDEVGPIKDFMRAKFASYAGHLANTDVFDEEMADAVAEMQRRYGVEPTGIVHYSTKVTMGYLEPAPVAKPALLTCQGTSVDMWTGPPADAARAVEDVATWQPVGNWPASPFPMWPSIQQGRAEINRILLDVHPDGDIWGAGFSQGAAVWSLVYMLDMLPAGAPLHHRLRDLKKVVTWGNPCREKSVANGNLYAGWPVLETRGIMEEQYRLKDTPDFWLDFANQGDLYTDCPDDDEGEWSTLVCSIVMGHSWFGAMVTQLLGLTLRPLSEIYAGIEAIMSAGMFFGSGTAPHLSYDTGPAINYLRAAS